jgi:hypothetical protein
MAYPRNEQETVLVYEAETNSWSAYSTVPKHIRKLQSLVDVNVLEIDEHGNPAAAKAVLTDKHVAMKKPREYTEEQREKMAKRLRDLR